MAESKEEYLKRYLSGPSKSVSSKKSKKTKKKAAFTSNGFKMIDDDAFAVVASVAKATTVSSDEEAEEQRVEEMAKKSANKGTFRPIGFSEVLPTSQSSSSVTTDKRKGEKSRHDSDTDDDPPVRRRHDSDSDPSPPRARQRKDSPVERRSRRPRHDSDSDPSPPRARPRSPSPSEKKQLSRRRHDSDVSPPRRNRGSASPKRSARRRHDSDSDPSPPRRRQVPSDLSPPAKRHRLQGDSHKEERGSEKTTGSSKRPAWSDDDISPPRRRPSTSKSDSVTSKSVKEEPKSPEPESSGRQRTLDGKVAGLQSAKDLRAEGERIRRQEEKMFEDLEVERSGRGVDTVYRTKQYGKRDKPEDKERKEREAKKQAELQDKYKEWNKGVLQIENRKAQLEEMARVAAEPLARAADDEAMNEHLRTVVHEDDPMQAFIRKKKTEDDIRSGKLVYPQYEGAWPPNRFGIPPGYRWDGVDRSNGFEGRLAVTANRRAADEREFYAAIANYE